MEPANVASEMTDTQGDDRWKSMHERFIAEAKEREPEVLFIGDSLIQNLAYTEVWRLFEPLHCLNFGMSADQTQHTLWRIKNGELECISPKVIVLMVGTNNHNHSADEVAEGILEITREIGQRQSQANLIVMGIPPRGQKPNPLREKIKRINQLVEEGIGASDNVQFLATDSSMFVSANDDTISHQDMYDYLHFTARGYAKLCEPLLDEIQNLLKQFLTADTASTEAE